MLGSNSLITQSPSTKFSSLKDDVDERECPNGTPPSIGSVSPRSVEESHYMETSSPSSTNNHGGNNMGNNGNGSHSIACSSTSSSGPNMESPQSSTETSQRTSFDFNSLFNNPSINNNNNDKSSNFDFGLQFGLGASEFQPSGLPNPFGASFPSFPFNNLESIMQLSQIFGNQIHGAPIQQNVKANPLQRQIPQTFEIKDQRNSPKDALNSTQSNKETKRNYPYTFQYCILCSKNVHSSKLPCHIRQCHVMKPMFQCPACDFTSTYSKNNVKSHMVSLHGLAGEPISYMDQYAGQVEEFMKQCFPNVRGRGRPVHGNNSPRSPQLISQQKGPLNNRQLKNMRQRNFAVNRQVGLPVTNNLGDMFAMLNQKQPNKDQIDPFSSSNALSYLRYMNPNLGCAPFPPQNNLLKQCNKEPAEEKMSMEQLLQNFTAPIVVPSRGHLDTKSSLEDNQPIESEQKQPLVGNEDENQSCFEPHYLPRNFTFSALASNQIDSTIFSTFANNSAELVEKLDLSQEFESLINENTSLLTKEQCEKVAEVRRKLNLQYFDVMYSVHRLDLDVLPLTKLTLVASIAPTEIDIKRFSLFERSNNMRNLGDDEQFVVQLSKVERLREKLSVMRLMATFDQNLQKIQQQLHDLSAASKLLHNSSEFHTILQLILVCANVINGDLNSELIAGFQTSSIVAICSFKLSNGVHLLDLLANRINRKFPELKSFFLHHSIIEAASNIDFNEIVAEIRRMEEARRGLETEFNACSNDTLADFLKHVDSELSQLNETVEITKQQLDQTLEFFGEAIKPTNDKNKSELFFRAVAEFSRKFQAALCRV